MNCRLIESFSCKITTNLACSTSKCYTPTIISIDYIIFRKASKSHFNADYSLKKTEYEAFHS